jgi:hypothetical protein
MFNHKNSKKLWTVLVILAVLVAMSFILQTQILAKLNELQTFFLKNLYVEDANPLPPKDYVQDANPLPPKDYVQDANPLPPVNLFWWLFK